MNLVRAHGAIFDKDGEPDLAKVRHVQEIVAAMKAEGIYTHSRLNTGDLSRLKGTPLPQDASFDELRLKDVPQGAAVKPGQRLDPLLHYAGRSHIAPGDVRGAGRRI